MPSKIAKNNSKEEVNKISEGQEIISDSLPEIDHNELLILPQDTSDSTVSEALAANYDGYIVQGPKSVLKVGSKVNTGFNNGQENSDNNTSSNLDSLDKIKKKFGFSWKNLSRRLAIAGIVAFILTVVTLTSLAAYGISVYNSTRNIEDVLVTPPESSIVYARDGKTEIYKFYKEKRSEIVNIKDVPLAMQLAVIGLEDEGFYYNKDGIPWKNIAGAASKCLLSAGDECRGGSGIYQQLVKNLTGDNQANFDRKIRELFLAVKINNSNKSKEDILGLYLNSVPFGRNAYGVQEAARTYFAKDIKDVNVVEACYIAALLQKNSYAFGIGQPESDLWKQFNTRKNNCLEKLHTVKLQGDSKDVFIKTDEEYQAAITQPATLAKNEADADGIRKNGQTAFVPFIVKDEFPHFREYIANELEKFVKPSDLYSKGYKIITTLDPDIQRNTEKILRDSENDIKKAGGNNAASIVLDGPTGEILSMVGSLGYNRDDIDGKVNIMTSGRQPGSSIKPMVYASALANGFNPGTILMDVQTDFGGGFKPKNFSGRFIGPVSFRNSIQQSLNIPTVKAACLSSISNGVPNCGDSMQKVFDFAEAAGLRFPCFPGSDGQAVCNDSQKNQAAYRTRCAGLASAIGGCEVEGLAHTTAINTLLQDGNLRTATPFISIKDNNNKEIYTTETKQTYYPSQDRAVDPLIAKQMQNILSDYEARRPAFGTYAKNLELKECKVAAKTGTTDNVTNTWTVGGCSNYTSSVWVGNTDSKPMGQDSSSSNTVAPIWNKVISSLENGKKPKEFNTDGLVKVNLDPSTGFIGGSKVEYLTPTQKKILEEAGAKIAKPEYNAFGKNIFENRSTAIVQEFQINKLDGKLATEKTLPENIDKKKCFFYAPEFPSPKNWADPVLAWNKDTGCKPNEKSDQDQVGEKSKTPNIDTNIQDNQSSVEKITLKATPQGSSDKKIIKTEILINGSLVASAENNDTVEFNSVDSYSSGKYTILLRATDSFQGITERTFSNISFRSSNSSSSLPSGNSLSQGDLQAFNVNCGSNNRYSSSQIKITCAIVNYPNGKQLPNNLKLYFGQFTNQGDSCRKSGSAVICENMTVPPTPGNYDIYTLSESLSGTKTQSKITVQ